MADPKKFDPALWVFRLVIVFLIFLIGGIFAQNKIQPFPWLTKSYKDLRTFIKEQNRKRPELIAENKYQRRGVHIHKKDKAYNGYTVIQGMFRKEGPALQLIGMDGKKQHEWPIRFKEIWPDGKHVFPPWRIPQGPRNYLVQGMFVYPDGSVVSNVNHLGAVKLDKCGKKVWSLDRYAHHSITPTTEGNLWFLANRHPDKVPKKLRFRGVKKPQLRAGHYEDLLLLVSPQGKVLREISVLQAVVDAGLEYILHDARFIKKSDPTHGNDIKIVTPALAARIKNVNAGDLLVSLRNPHMLAILDIKTGKLKWYRQGPWVRQHDPEITKAGLISVFNNGHRDFVFGRIKGSNITVLDPQSDTSNILFPKQKKDRFESTIWGDHEYLPNGNILIIESHYGRLIEITPGGEVVWDFVKSYGKKHAAVITRALRFSEDYFTVGDWTCPAEAK